MWLGSKSLSVIFSVLPMMLLNILKVENTVIIIVLMSLLILPSVSLPGLFVLVGVCPPGSHLPVSLLAW